MADVTLSSNEQTAAVVVRAATIAQCTHDSAASKAIMDAVSEINRLQDLLHERPAHEPPTEQGRSPDDFVQVHGALVRVVMEAGGCPPPCSHEFHKLAIASVIRIAKDALKRVIPAPFGHDEAQARIAYCVREIEAIADSFGYDPTQWLADDEQPSQPPPVEQLTCTYEMVDGPFLTGCGRELYLDVSSCRELYDFCPHCGKPVEETTATKGEGQ